MNYIKDFFIAKEELLADQAKQAAIVVFPDVAFETNAEFSGFLDAGSSITKTLLSIEQAVESTEGLQAIATALENTKSSTDIDQTTAAITGIGVESIYKRLGISKKNNTFSMETFSSEKSRTQSTVIAIEELADSIRTAWEAIIRVIKAMSKAIMAFLRKLFDVNRTVSERVIFLKKKMLDYDTLTPANNTLKPKVSIRHIKVGEKVPTNLVSTLSNSVKVVKAVAGMINEVDDLIKSSGGFGWVDKATSIDFSPPGFTHAQLPQQESDISVLRSLELPGNMAIYVKQLKTKPKNKVELLDSTSKIRILVAEFKETTSIQGNDQMVPTLSKPLIEDILKEVADVNKSMIALGDSCEAIQKTRNEWIIDLEKSITAEDNAKSDMAKHLQKFITNVSRINNELLTVSSKYVLTTLNAVIDYVEVSVKEYNPNALKA